MHAFSAEKFSALVTCHAYYVALKLANGKWTEHLPLLISPLVGKSKSYYELVKKLFSIRSFLNKINADVETEVIKGQLFRIRAG